MKFSELQIIQPILRALEGEGYVPPSPIQEQAIPPALKGRDVLGCAQTGTGKTAAFAVPILQLLSARPPHGGAAQGGKRPIRSLILTPTRELALQIHESFGAYDGICGCAARSSSAGCRRTRRWRRWAGAWTSSSPRPGG